MDEPRDYHTKCSVSDRERQIPRDIIYTWNINMTQMHLSTKQKETHRHRDQACGCQWGFGGEGGMNWISCRKS